MFLNRCANEAHLNWTEWTQRETREWETKRRRERSWWKRAKGYHPPKQTAHTVSLRRKSAETQKVQMPSGLGGYATSRDNRASFTLASPARAICSWREWVGERTPCTSRTPRGPKIQQDGSLKSAWCSNEWIKIWMKIILFVIWADTMEVGDWIGRVRLLQWEWEHVWGFSEKQWWKESNCYNSRGEGGREEVWMHANIYTYSTQAQMHSVERHNSGHSSCIGKWNKGTESRSLWLVCECRANLIQHCLRSDVLQIYRGLRYRSLSSYDKSLL